MLASVCSHQHMLLRPCLQAGRVTLALEPSARVTLGREGLPGTRTFLLILNDALQDS